MSFKRRVLSALGKNVLLEIGGGLELDVTTRMSVEELRDASANSKRTKLDAIVQESLSRDTLKDICGAVELDEAGKLNQLVAEDEEQSRKVRGPGLPAPLDPKDSRWFSTDCIEPPPVGS
jgi:hypothetical protein